jgi:hypothetical protein
MQLIRTLIATAALVGGVAIANAQQAPSSSQPGARTGAPDPMSGASTSPDSTRTNPSPGMSATTGAGDARSGSGQPGGSESQKTLEGSQGAERNPDGSTGGSTTNPSPPNR